MVSHFDHKKNTPRYLILFLFLFLFYSLYLFFSAGPLFASIFIYNGPGTMGVSELTSLLKKTFPYESISGLDAQELLKDEGRHWMDKANIFVMPGGLGDRHYTQSLGEKGKKIIESFVKERGGTYIGICAGAYFVSSHVSYHKGDFKVDEDRPDPLFLGEAKGPLYEMPSLTPYQYTYLYLNANEGKTFKLRLKFFYKDGPFFNLEKYKEALGLKEIKVLASYSGENLPEHHDISNPSFYATGGTWLLGDSLKKKELPAMVFFPWGRGKVFLSGVHPEYTFLEKDSLKWFEDQILQLHLLD